MYRCSQGLCSFYKSFHRSYIDVHIFAMEFDRFRIAACVLYIGFRKFRIAVRERLWQTLCFLRTDVSGVCVAFVQGE